MIPLLLWAGCHVPPPPVAWEPGEQRAWHLSLQSRLLVAGDEARPALELQVRGTWRQTALRVEGPLTWARVELDEPVLQSQAADAAVAEAMAALEGELSTALLAEVDDGGAVVAVHTPSSLSDLSRSLLEGMLGLTQWVRPPTDARSWEVEQADPNGRHRVRYTLGEDGAGERHKTVYLSGPEIVRSDHTFHLDERGRLTDLRVDEALVVTDAALLGRAEARTGLALSGLELTRVPDPLALLDGLDAVPRRALDAPAPPSTDTTGRDAAAVAGRSLAELRATHQTAGREQAVHAFAGLVGLLRLQPAAVAEVDRLIREAAADTPTLLGALGDAGTPPAQAALRGLWQDSPLPAPMRERALIALQRSSAPAPETVELYLGLLQDAHLRRQALYALGTAAHHLAATDTARARAITQVLAEQLAAPEARVDALRALSNAGARDTLEQVRPWLSSPEDRVRLAAFESLHAVPGDDVDVLLRAAATGDGAEIVRQAAIEAGRRRRPDAAWVATLRQAALHDEGYTSRLEAVRGLAAWSLRDPTLRPILEEIVTTEVRPEIAAVAREALETRGD